MRRVSRGHSDFGGVLPGLAGIAAQIHAIAGAFRSPELVALGERLAREGEWVNRLAAVGWLPHYTTPFHLIGGPEVPASISDEIVGYYYAREWSQVADAFAARVGGYSLDEEAKATFREALAAHGAGLYRIAPRLLFPEIERVTRQELQLDPVKTSVRPALRAAVGRMTPRMLEPSGTWGLHMVRRLDSHFYKRVGIDVDRFASDQVPNRNAALHGLVRYATSKSSFNALVIGDFALKIVSVVREYGLADVVRDGLAKAR